MGQPPYQYDPSSSGGYAPSPDSYGQGAYPPPDSYRQGSYPPPSSFPSYSPPPPAYPSQPLYPPQTGYPPYGAPMPPIMMNPYTGPLAQPEPGGGFAITGFVLSMVSIVSLFLPLLDLIGVFVGIGGLIFSILGMRRARLRGLAIAGLVISIIALLLYGLLIVFVIYDLTHTPLNR